MTITCPHCGFARQVEEARLPEKPVRATCPRCHQGFLFNPGEGGRPQAAAPVAAPPIAAWSPAAATGATAPDAAGAAKAGFWIRAVASLLDMLALGLLESALGALLVRAGGTDPGFDSPEGRMVMLTVASFGVVLGYAYRVFFIGYCGQTPGKMAVRVKVIRTDGSEVGYFRAFLREVLGKFLSKLILGIGYLMVAVDARKQGLHDKIADTYVIKT
jgi:uncharacterized RDD family membrane protein YckC